MTQSSYRGLAVAFTPTSPPMLLILQNSSRSLNKICSQQSLTFAGICQIALNAHREYAFSHPFGWVKSVTLHPAIKVHPADVIQFIRL